MKGFVLLAAFVVLLASSFDINGQKVRLRSQITPDCPSAGSNLKYADIFADGNIAVQGSYNCRGAFIYNISNPDAPVLSSWYNPGNNLQFLEAIVIGNRGYFGSGNGGGVHIVDLTNPAAPQLLGVVNSANGGGFGSIHEMVVWGDYLIENSNSFSNKLIKVINISDPAAAFFVRDINPTETLWVHAMHIRGNRMFTSGWGSSTNRGRTEIYDITNIGTQTPALLGFVEDQTSITAGNNMHSSWSSENGNFLYSARETNNGTGDIRVYDITNPALPLLVKSISMAELGLNAVTPHNPAVFGNYLYVSWYQAGVQVFDISTPANPVRVGQYDTFQATFAPPEQEKQAALDAEPWDMICGSEFRQNALPTTYDGNWAVFPFLGNNKVLAGDLTNGLLVLDASDVGNPPRNKVADFDGDGKTDLSDVEQGSPPSSYSWSVQQSSDSNYRYYGWGGSDDKLVNGDFDGDGKSDIVVWRPSNGTWHLRQSQAGDRVVQWGANGDVPVAGDYDADGKTDIAVWRPSTGVWYIIQSTLGVRTAQWGIPGDKAFAGDYDGDGKDDIVVWRPSNGNWYIIQSSSSIPVKIGWGQQDDKPLIADFNGDGRAELTVLRPSDNTWYIFNPFTGFNATYVFGVAGDIPAPADYDGDSKFDVSVYRPSNKTWYRLNSSDGAFVSGIFFGYYAPFQQFTARPLPASAQPE